MFPQHSGNIAHNSDIIQIMLLDQYIPIVDDTKFQQVQENIIFFQIFDIFYQNIIIRE